MSDQSTHINQFEPAETPFSVSNFVRTLRAYMPFIVVTVLGAGVAYLIIAIASYLLAPSQRVTTLAFRLDFSGAERGQYPNATKFTPTEVVSSPVLVKTFQQNDLGRFTTFADFASSIFVLESNPAAEALTREYQARLSDVRLSSVDRDRLQREYELKLASLNKNLLAISYVRKKKVDRIPDTLAKKVLNDILKNWVDFATNERQVFVHQVPLLSPDVVAGEPSTSANSLVAALMLRGKISALLGNIRQIRALVPNAELGRTKDGLTLGDLAVRLDELVRYGLDPLIGRTVASGLVSREETIRFLQAQLAYDQRLLAAQRSSAETAQRTLDLYMNATPAAEPVPSQPDSESSRPSGSTPKEGETIMPQVNDTFIDRLIQLSASSADTQYRQNLSDEFRRLSYDVIPLQQAVDYDQTILDLALTSSTGGESDRESVRAELVARRAEARRLAVQVQEVYATLSRNLNPSTQLLTPSAPFTRVERGISLGKIALFGILTLCVALIAAVVLSLLHSRIRSEEVAEEELAAEARVLP
jgi:hypothetical protein